MHEAPANLSTETLGACLQSHYGLVATEVCFLPLGLDAAAWVYQARTADGASYFLKVRTGRLNEPGLLVPHYLKDHGVAGILAPIPTITGALWASTGDYALIVYPFIDGKAGMDQGLSDQQWVDCGAVLGRIHATVLDPELASTMRRESYVPAGADMVRRLDEHIGTDRVFADPAVCSVAIEWRVRRPQIRNVLKSTESLGRRLEQTRPAFVLCHADIHTGNVMLGADQRVWIVDWDEVVLAPKERDLMFVVGGIGAGLVTPNAEKLFFQGYGSTTVDPLALAYYRYAWAVNDIGAFGEEVFFHPELGSITKQASAKFFLSLFLPGNIVARAQATNVPTRDRRYGCLRKVKLLSSLGTEPRSLM